MIRFFSYFCIISLWAIILGSCLDIKYPVSQEVFGLIRTVIYGSVQPIWVGWGVVSEPVSSS